MKVIFIMIYIMWLPPTAYEVHVYETEKECADRIAEIYRATPGGRRDYTDAACFSGDPSTQFAGFGYQFLTEPANVPRVTRYHVH